MTNSEAIQLPLVVHLGFSGSRTLFSGNHSQEQYAQMVQRAEEAIIPILQSLPAELGFGPHHFLCSVSQLAIGGDFIFTRTCKRLGIKQRIFLPQSKDEFFRANGSAGRDFSDSERSEGMQLLNSEHIIQKRVVTTHEDRKVRFEQTNLEIVRASDVVVCLLREGAAGGTAGASAVVEKAKRRGKPVLELRIGWNEDDEDVSVNRTWHNRESFLVPQPPEELDELAVRHPSAGTAPSHKAYVSALKDFGSQEAKFASRVFHQAAVIIIATHVLATVIAAVLLAAHPSKAMMNAAHSCEFILLLLGFSIHQYLHHYHVGRRWAYVRLIAEINRSVQAVGQSSINSDYLFRLPFPASLRPVLRTLNVLKLQSNEDSSNDEWTRVRDEYLSKRILKAESWYAAKAKSAKRWLGFASAIFAISSIVAMIAVFIHTRDPNWAGVVGIIMPVIAVAGMSLVAAADMEARFETFSEASGFLAKHAVHFESANSSEELSLLMTETEERLLGETVNWYSRRSFLGVA